MARVRRPTVKEGNQTLAGARASDMLPRHGSTALYRRRFDLCLSIILIGVAKKSNSSRKRFSRCRKNEKCKPALPPEVKTTKVGGLTPICVMYCTCSRDPL